MSLRDMVIKPATPRCARAAQKRRKKLETGRAIRHGNRKGEPPHCDFHLTAKVISRGKGQSAVAAAEYRWGEWLRDEQADEQKFYQARAERIEFTATWCRKKSRLGAGSRRPLEPCGAGGEAKDAQLSRKIELSLPHELTPQQRESLVKDLAREAFVRRAARRYRHPCAGQSERRPDHRAHIMVTMRTLDGRLRGQERPDDESGSSWGSGASNGRISPTPP